MITRSAISKQVVLAFALGFFFSAFVLIEFRKAGQTQLLSQLAVFNDPGLKWPSSNALKSSNAQELQLQVETGKAAGETVAEKLYKEVRVFCWIMTSPKNRDKTAAVKATWAKRCNGYVFISSEDNATIPAVNASVPEGRDHLWGKTKFGFR